jgi:septum formation protein
MKLPLILASKSPRRKEILQDLGFQPRVFESNIKEISDPWCRSMEDKVISIARKKADAVSSILNGTISENLIIAADTIVCLKEEILGKPKNQNEAVKMLKNLSGNKHTVITATVIIDRQKKTNFEMANKTIVNFKKLTNEGILDYLRQNEYSDKAGAYGIQNNGDRIIENIEGDYFNVMGLSVTTLIDYFKTYHNIEISAKKLMSKHGHMIRKFRSDGD